jgi:hypothetical protein
VTVHVARGAVALTAVACRAGRDLSVTLTGGDSPHIGCVVIARAHPAQDDPGRTTVTCSVVSHPPHREEALARPVAERLARRLGATVVVAAGVHVKGLTREGIAAYVGLAAPLAARLVARLEG